MIQLLRNSRLAQTPRHPLGVSAACYAARLTRTFGFLVLLVAVLPGCVGVHAGALYDYQRATVVPTAGVFLEGFAGFESAGRVRPMLGGRSSLLVPGTRRVNVSVQPEVSLPLTSGEANERWAATLAVGPALRPTSLNTSACLRDLGIVSYGFCQQWFSEGLIGADANLSFFFPILFADLFGVH